MLTQHDFTFDNLDKDFTKQQITCLASNVSFGNKQHNSFFKGDKLTEKGIKHIKGLLKNKHKSPLFVSKLSIYNCPRIDLIDFSKEEIAGIDFCQNESGLYDYTFSLYSALLLKEDERLPNDIQHKLTAELVKNFIDYYELWNAYCKDFPQATKEEKALYQKCSLKYYTFKVEIPLFLANQIKRHIIGVNFTEISKRYETSENTFYLPKKYTEEGLLPAAPENKRQGRGEGWVKEQEVFPQTLKFFDIETQKVDFDYKVGFDLDCIFALSSDYYEANKEIIAPETARIVLPQATYTTLIMSISVSAAARMCSLRLDRHAQEEAQIFAQQVKDFFLTVEPEFERLIEIAKK